MPCVLHGSPSGAIEPLRLLLSLFPIRPHQMGFSASRCKFSFQPSLPDHQASSLNSLRTGNPDNPAHYAVWPSRCCRGRSLYLRTPLPRRASAMFSRGRLSCTSDEISRPSCFPNQIFQHVAKSLLILFLRRHLARRERRYAPACGTRHGKASQHDQHLVQST